jgi:hypothetical protein
MLLVLAFKACDSSDSGYYGTSGGSTLARQTQQITLPISLALLTACE